MTDKEYKKIIADARRSVSRKYGFRQSSYINFKVDGGYFFCLFFLTDEARLTVKPMYADDLWWDIWDASENKKEPMSLRGTGAYSLSGQVLATYDIKGTTDKSKLESLFDQLFNDATAAITMFIADNPDADLFYPDESKMDHDPDRLLYIMALIHNGKEEDALAIIKEARKSKHRCEFQSGMFSDSYTYIRRWCNRNHSLQKYFFRIYLALNKITKYFAFVKMSMSWDRRFGLPNHQHYSPMQAGIIVASAYTCIALGSYIGAVGSLIVLGLLWVLLENKKSLHYYAEFLKLPPKVQKRWTIFSWIATAVLWIYIFAIIVAL